MVFVRPRSAGKVANDQAAMDAAHAAAAKKKPKAKKARTAAPKREPAAKRKTGLISPDPELVALMAEAEERRKADAVKIVGDAKRPLHERVDAAQIAGYDIVARGPKDLPRRIVFRSLTGKHRVTFMFPRGKVARQRFEDENRRRGGSPAYG